MRDDIVERLRDYAESGSRPWIGIADTFRAAAGEIERLRHELERLGVIYLTKQSSDPALVKERAGYFAQCALHCTDHFDQGSGDFVSGKGLTYVKDYLEGRLNIAFIFANTNIAAVCKAGLAGSLCGMVERSAQMHKDIDGVVAGEAGQHFGKFDRRHGGHRGGRDDELMFVSNVQQMQSAKPFVPARIRFQRLDLSDDLFSGQLGLSVLHGAYKGVLALGEGELNAFRAESLVSDHSKDRQVKRAAEIMDRIPNDQPKFGWEGYHLFNEVNLSIGFGLPSSHQTKRFLAEIGLYPPVQVVDVVLCPFDL